MARNIIKGKHAHKEEYSFLVIYEDQAENIAPRSVNNEITIGNMCIVNNETTTKIQKKKTTNWGK